MSPICSAQSGCSPFFLFPPTQSSFLPSPGRERRELSSERAIVEMSIRGLSLGGTEGVAFFVNMLGQFFPHGHADAGPGPQCLSGFSGSWRTSPQLHVSVPISSEQTEEAEKEELRVQLKRHHPSSPLSGSKACKRPKIKVSLISQGDAAGGPCTPSSGGAPEGECLLACLNNNRRDHPRDTALPPWRLLTGQLLLCLGAAGTQRKTAKHVGESGQ